MSIDLQKNLNTKEDYNIMYIYYDLPIFIFHFTKD